MRYTTLDRAMTAAGKGYLETDRDVLREVVNASRQELYSMYREASFFVDIQECFEVQRFCVTCDDGGETYQGITLPRGYGAVEAMWYDGIPVQLYDRWRAWQEGISSPCDCGLEKHDMGDNFPSERDIAGPSRLVVVAQDTRDFGKKFIIRGMTVTGPAEHTFLLSDSPQQTSAVFKSIDRPGGIVKDQTVGCVVLAQDNGRKLSIYAPEEVVPAYKRIKITGIPSGCGRVNIMAARQFYPVHEHMDVVETGNLRVWELMARYLKLDRKDGRDRNDIISGEKFKADARAALLGDQSRQLGKATQVQIVVPTHYRRRLGRR